MILRLLVVLRTTVGLMGDPNGIGKKSSVY